MRSGAADYLLKGSLKRLPAAIERELRERRGRGERVRAETALRETEASFRVVIESLPDAVVIHRHGRMVFVNDAAVSLLGLPRAELVGRAVVDFIPPDDHARIAPRIEDAARAPGPVSLREQRIVRADGSGG